MAKSLLIIFLTAACVPEVQCNHRIDEICFAMDGGQILDHDMTRLAIDTTKEILGVHYNPVFVYLVNETPCDGYAGCYSDGDIYLATATATTEELEFIYPKKLSHELLHHYTGDNDHKTPWLFCDWARNLGIDWRLTVEGNIATVLMSEYE